MCAAFDSNREQDFTVWYQNNEQENLLKLLKKRVYMDWVLLYIVVYFNTKYLFYYYIIQVEKYKYINMLRKMYS